MGDDNTEQKKRKFPWKISYSNMTIKDAEKKLGIMMTSLREEAVSVTDMLSVHIERVERDVILKTKEKVYERILEHFEMEGFPGEEEPDFKEANVNDLVHSILSPIVTDFRRQTGRNIRLRREKQIVSMDCETGGSEEFVMMDVISVTEKNFVFVIEAKRSSLGQAMKQCLLAMKDMRDKSKKGEVYGFITTGDDWRMVTYDGSKFRMTDKFTVLFDTMHRRRDEWMEQYSVLVDCMYVALNNGGVVTKDMVA